MNWMPSDSATPIMRLAISAPITLPSVTEHHGNECHQHEDLPDQRIGRIERHQQRAGGAGERQGNAERNGRTRGWG